MILGDALSSALARLKADILDRRVVDLVERLVAKRRPMLPVVAEVPPPPKDSAFEPDEPGGGPPDPAEVATLLTRLRAAAAPI
jgi:hypothetical protein